MTDWRSWVNEPDLHADPRVMEGDARELLPLLPADSVELIVTSPPYPRAQRQPEDLGRYRRFVDEDGSVIPEASEMPHARQNAKKFAAKGRLSQRDGARRADLQDAGRSPHVAKNLAREGFTHGKPNLKGETGLQVQIHPDEWWDWFRPFAIEMLRILKPRRALLLNVGGVVCPTWNHHTYDWDLPSQMRSIGWNFVRPMYWVKPNGAPTTGEGVMTNCVEHVFWFSKAIGDDHGPVWFPWELSSHGPEQVRRPIVRNVVRFAVGQTRWPEGQAHYACFPRELAAWAVRGWSAPARAAGGMLSEQLEADLVLDPFLGSGTTALEAAKQGRRWIGVEMNPEGELDCLRARFEMEREAATAAGSR